MYTRRFFVRGSALVMAGAGSLPGWLARAATTAEGRRKVLVAIFQRGAADGLNMVVPFGERRYYDLRPTIAIQPPGAPQGAIDLDGRFGLHNSLQPLKDLWDKQQLAIVEAAGSPDPSRSHFDAQDFMESGTPGVKSGEGWLNRALPAEVKASPVQAIAAGERLPLSLRGNRPAVALGDLQQFQIRDADSARILENMYTSAADAQLAHAGKDAFAAMKMIQALNREPYKPASGAEYGQGGGLGRSLQQIARLIKADVGVEAAFAEIDGWDHHGNENPQMFNLLRQFSMSLAAFSKDLGDRMEDVVLVTMSEFGRTAAENGNAGTDHGHGSVMFVLGGPVRGGKIYGQWPGLEPEQLNENRDLAVTTDFRAVLGEVVAGHLGQTNLSQVFPGYQSGAPLGLLRA